MNGTARFSASPRAEEISTRPPTQREVLRHVLLMAARYGAWMTLEELARKTGFPEASISAQLRHLRKPGNGGFEIAKRRRTWQEALKTNTHEKVWEYQIRP